MSSVTFTWHTHRDPKTCEFCYRLHGHQWEFYVEKVDDLPHQLTYKGRVVWDLDKDQSRAHGDKPWNCRCTIGVEVDEWRLRENLDDAFFEGSRTQREMMSIPGLG